MTQLEADRKVDLYIIQKKLNRMREQLGADCLYCGYVGELVLVHGHTQCPRCTAVVDRCCE